MSDHVTLLRYSREEGGRHATLEWPVRRGRERCRRCVGEDMICHVCFHKLLAVFFAKASLF